MSTNHTHNERLGQKTNRIGKTTGVQPFFREGPICYGTFAKGRFQQFVPQYRPTIDLKGTFLRHES
jgi:hypothetical protein